MANNVGEWSATAASNTSLGAVSLQENIMLVNAVNNAFRELMAQVATGISAGAFMAAYTPASASAAASLQFLEDTDNGTNKVTVTAPAALGSDVTATLPSSTGTLALTSDIPAAVTAASQAEQEAATEAGKYVAPATQHLNPSALKAWVKAGVTGNILASYNVTSVTDTGTGQAAPNWDTDFSSANYGCDVSYLSAASALMVRINSQAAGSVGIITFTTTPAAADPDAFFAMAAGDQ